jgi:acyl dehydratase
MERSVITDEMRAMVGKWQGEPYAGGEVHVEDIYKFAKSVGDNNPLWLDVDYASGTRWGGIVAPPTFVDRFTPFYVLGDDNSQGFLGGPMPVERPFKHGFSAGDEHEIRRPVRPGDFITVTTTISDLFEKRGRPGVGLMLFVRYVKTYRNQRNEIVSICRWTSVGYEGPDDDEQESSGPPPTVRPTPDAGQTAPTTGREIPWATQVHFEDVEEGSDLTPLDKLQTQKRFIRWAQASNDLSDIHYDYQLMRDRGMPDVVGQGALSAAYIVNMLSDWYAPDGFMKSFGVQYRHYSLPGDVLTTRGVVTSKYEEYGDNLVEVDVWAENQDGRRVTVGHAVVSLPSRKN